MISFDEVIRTALAAAAYLREEADFNRSWADGRRGQPLDTPAYKARRIEAAEEREAWAEAIESLTAVCPPTILCSDCPPADYPTDKTRCLPCPRRKACLDGYAAWKMQKRNEWMADKATRIVALWDGSPGGTANCIAYASKIGRPIDNLWTLWTTVYA